MPLRITLAEPAQAELVHRVMQLAYAEYLGRLHPPSGAHRETVSDVARAMARGGAILAWEGSQPVGSARFRVEPDHVYVDRVAVLPSHRRRGIASAIMRAAEGVANELGRTQVRAHVRGSLPDNLRLYQHLGFEVSQVDAHPGGPDKVILIVKQLKAGSGEPSPPT